jgi:cell division protein FtsZ
MPLRARWNAVLAPIHPAPRTTTSARVGRPPRAIGLRLHAPFISVPPNAHSVPETWRLGTSAERARVAIVGCGGAGCNVLRVVVPPASAERIAVNDTPTLAMAGISRRILIPPGNLSAHASMDEKVVGKMETDEEKAIVSALLDRDAVIALGGLGGQFGGWALSLVGRCARILGDLRVALATTPFRAEGSVRLQLATDQLALLQRKVDGLVMFGNDALLAVAPDLPIAKAFAASGAIIARSAAGLATVLSRSDVPPLKRLLARSKDWRFGMGGGTGKHACFIAVEEAYKSPWFALKSETVRGSIVLIRQPQGAAREDEILREVRLRSPGAEAAWAVLPEPSPEDRVEAMIFAGLGDSSR